MTKNDSIARIKDDVVERFGEDKVWFDFEKGKLPDGLECKIMFVAERPSGQKGKEMSKFTKRRFCLFQGLREKSFQDSSYTTDCIKTYPINSWKERKERLKENERDFEEQKEYLKREIDCVKPSIIVPLGNEAERLIKKCVKDWEELKRITLLDKIWHYSYINGKDFTSKYERKFGDLKKKIDCLLKGHLEKH